MKRALLIAGVLIALGAFAAQAADCEEPTAECYNKGASLSSGNFRILDPQHAAFGGTSSSSSNSFRLLGAIGDLAIGWSSNSDSLQLKSGFLYFPLIISPNITAATPGTTSVTLTWSPLRATLQTTAGLVNTTYQVCYGTSTPSTCISATPTSTVVSPLSTSTTYVFRVQAFDFYGNLISESEIVSATTTATPTPTPGGGGGGGGGGSIPTPTPGCTLTGLAFPYGTVHVMFNGVEVTTTPTNGDAVFTVNRANLPPGSVNFGFWGTDRLGRRSVTWSWSVPITGCGGGRVTGLIVPPTIIVSPTSLAVGGTVTVVGESVPGATVEVVMNPSGRTASVVVAPNGSYSATLPTSGLTSGIYDIKARTLLLPANDQSTWSQTIQIGVGVPAPAACNHPPDVNRDTRINLVDFSVMAFWWRKTLPGDSAVDLNCDTVLTLADFSILAYHWTGR